MNDPFLLACHVASKVCHDVIAPAGVINQTLEMLDMPLDAEARENYEQLLSETSDAMARRLNFLRFVFGTQGLASEPANIGEIRQLADGYAGLYKPTLSWSLEASDLSHVHMRMLLLMVMIGTDGLPWGGEIVAGSRRDDDGALTLSVVGKAKRVDFRDGLRQAVRGEAPADRQEARNIHPVFAHMLAARLGSQMHCEMSESHLRLETAGIRTDG